MGLFDSVVRYKNQEYDKLKKECQTKGTLFIDTEFPPDDRSLSSTPGKFGGVVWKRPKQICSDPMLFVEGASAGDVTQGKLGNCWFVAASSCLASFKEVWHKVIPDVKGQEWDSEKPDNYQGIFRFQFWRYGHWVEVVVDDMLPTINDELVFIHSQSKNEFWSALLEKAYAKLFGNYEALDGGELSEALEDFSGGVSDTLDMLKMELASKSEERVALFARMQKEMDRKSLMAASIPASSADDMEAVTDIGLVKGHAYGITAVKNVHLEGSGLFGLFNREKLPMIRLRNPWGQGEWKGAFSDGSPEWEKISKSDRDKIGLTFEEDGEFWMTFEDYCKYFVQTCICRVVNTSYLSLAKTWHEGLAHGAWAKPNRAGGCPNNKDTFLNNPQYSFDVTEDSDECMIQLMQKSTRDKEGSQNVTMGFTILKVELNRELRIHDLDLQERFTSTIYRNSRSIFLRHGPFKKGRYVVIPSTFDPGHEAEFLLRVYTSAANDFKELTLDRPKKPWYNCCGRAPCLVTQIKVVRAIDLEKQERSGADPYCIVSCEGKRVTLSTCKDTTSPEWNTSAVFYRTQPHKKPVKIQIWNNNILRDEFMGRHLLESSNECKMQALEVGLMGRKAENNTVKPGKVTIIVTQSRQLMSV
ncbi:calpain-5 [Plakobranchus ocellatus]|uniref:Calpain-5 n=1 Tax=Plakobranchus ocellatus TaxID=259542 RepID=A0AAV3Y9Q8_9GAST|nr:calpain-5 [Plakobranchus ocellatus]